jgi:hypothetical protein
VVKQLRLLEVVAFGAVLMLIVLMVQPDSRKVPRDIVSSSNQSVSDSKYASVAKSLKKALDKEPETVFCVADYGLPLPGAEMNLESYFCNRWAGSLNGDESVFIWGSVSLGWSTKEDLEEIKDTLAAKTVLVVRLTRPAGSDSEVLAISDTWWAKYVNPSWELVTVD